MSAVGAPLPRRFAALGLAAVALVACKSEPAKTAIVFEVSSDLTVGASREINLVMIAVYAGGAQVGQTRMVPLDADPLASRFAVERGPTGPATVNVSFSVGNPCDAAIVTRMLRTDFVADETIHVPVALNAACAKTSCPPTKTCVPGWGCIDPEVDRTGTPLALPVGPACACDSFFPMCLGAAWRLKSCPPNGSMCEEKVWRVGDYGLVGNGEAEQALGLYGVKGFAIMSTSRGKRTKRWVIRDPGRPSRLLWQKDENFDIAWRSISVDLYVPGKLRLDDGAELPSEPWSEVYTVHSINVRAPDLPTQLTDNWSVVDPPAGAPTRFGDLRCLKRTTDPSFNEPPATTYCFARNVGKVFELSDYGSEELVGATVPVPPDCANPGLSGFPGADPPTRDPIPDMPTATAAGSLRCDEISGGSISIDPGLCDMRAKMVDAGRDHICVLRADEHILCWGSNVWGESMPPSGAFKSITAGDDHNCALDEAGRVSCWGDSIGLKTASPQGEFTEVGAGRNHNCALRKDGAIVCWGADVFEQTHAPQGTFVALSVSGNHACALDANGAAVCWGQNSNGENIVPPGVSFKEIAAGGDHTCGIRADDGTVLCWGESITPSEVSPPPGPFVHITAGGDHSCGLRPSGLIECWGEDHFGETTNIPSGAFESVAAGRRQVCAIRTNGTLTCWGFLRGASVEDSTMFVQVSAGSDHTCRLADDGRVTCWGENTQGETQVPPGRYKQVAAGAAHSCGILADGTLICWGKNDLGQTLAPPGGFVAVSAGDEHSCALRADGAVLCWGQSDNGEALPPPGSFRAVSVGVSHSCAIRSSDGTLHCWGENNDAQIEPPTGAFTQVASGRNFNCALRADRTLACWGETTGGKTNPPSRRFTEVTAGRDYACALDDGGTVTCWGDPRFGTLPPAPVAPVPSGPFKHISAGKDHVCGLRPTGAIECWGGESEVPPSVPLDCASP